MNPDILLSDKFIEFSTKIAQLHEVKKEKLSAFKEFYEEHKKSIKQIDEEALSLNQEFEDWQANFKKSS